jgi:hypothetical protein
MGDKDKPDSGNNDDWKKPVQKRQAENGRRDSSDRTAPRPPTRPDKPSPRKKDD